MRTPRELKGDFVRKAQAGDSDAREQILRRIRPILHRYFIKRIGIKPEVEDLVQNTLVRVHSSLNDLRQPDRLMGFVMKAALYELHDLYRGRYGPKETTYDPSAPPELADSGGGPGDRVDLDRAMGALTERARHILELREYGYRYREIAEMLNTTEAAVKMQVKRAFKRLRQLLVA